MHARSGGIDPGRDGCRVPLPWSGDRPPFGFSPAGATGRPWLSQAGRARRGLTVEAQLADPGSMLRLYRAALRIRHDEPALGDGGFAWLPAGPGVLAFARDDRFVHVTNLSDRPVRLPPHESVLLSQRRRLRRLPAVGRVGLAAHGSRRGRRLDEEEFRFRSPRRYRQTPVPRR